MYRNNGKWIVALMLIALLAGALPTLAQTSTPVPTGTPSSSDSSMLRLELRGVVEEIDGGLAIVSGQPVDLSQAREINARLRVGMRVKVEYRLVNGMWVVDEIDQDDDDSSDDSNDDSSDDAPRMELYGPIERLDATTIVVGGQTINLREAREIRAQLRVGEQVEIKFRLQNGVWVVDEIDNDDDDSDDDNSRGRGSDDDSRDDNSQGRGSDDDSSSDDRSGRSSDDDRSGSDDSGSDDDDDRGGSSSNDSSDDSSSDDSSSDDDNDDDRGSDDSNDDNDDDDSDDD
jgi:hypothetical protein